MGENNDGASTYIKKKRLPKAIKISVENEKN